MTWLHWIAGSIAAICSLYSFVPYVRGIRRGKPASPSSWIIWAVVAAEITAALWFAGGRAQLGLPAAETAGCTLIAVLAWRAARRRAGRALDADKLPRWAVAALMAACGVALIGWWFAGPVLAACLLVGVDFTAGAITSYGLRTDPDAEPLNSWWWYGSGELASCGTAIGAGWVFWVSPGSGLVVAVSVIAMAWVGGVTVSRQRFRPRHAATAASLPAWLLVAGAFVLVALLGAGLEAFARIGTPVTGAATGTSQLDLTGPETPAPPEPSENYYTPRQQHHKRDSDDRYYSAAPVPPTPMQPAAPVPTTPAPVVSLGGPGPAHTTRPPTHTPAPPPTPDPSPRPSQPSPTPAPDPSPVPSPSSSDPSSPPPSSPGYG